MMFIIAQGYVSWHVCVFNALRQRLLRLYATFVQGHGLSFRGTWVTNINGFPMSQLVRLTLLDLKSISAKS